MKITRALSAVLCLCLLTGCADVLGLADRKNEQRGLQKEYSGVQSGAAHVDYEVPVSIPKILVNQVGYRPESNKTAVFRGEKLPARFSVINEETGETVYTGTIGESRYNAELEEYNSYGTFSEVQEPGQYYIKADTIGLSYPFEIKEDVYTAIYYDAFRRYADNVEEPETCVMCEQLTVLLMSYELYADTYTDDMNIPESGNGIPDILDVMKKSAQELMKRQNESTGGVGAGSGMTEDNAEASLYYAAVMAKFYHTYKLYDADYADNCLRAAQTAFYSVQNSLPRLDGGFVYFAAAELYRATGAAKYAALINEYGMPDNRRDMQGTSGYFYGDVAYLSTTYKVNTNVCETLMTALCDRVEAIAGDSKAQPYLTCANKEQSNNEALLADMMELSVVNYIIANHEYDTVLQNHLHYFLGRNAKCITYLPGVGYTYCAEEEALFSNAVWNARFLAMLSAIR